MIFNYLFILYFIFIFRCCSFLVVVFGLVWDFFVVCMRSRGGDQQLKS